MKYIFKKSSFNKLQISNKVMKNYRAKIGEKRRIQACTLSFQSHFSFEGICQSRKSAVQLTCALGNLMGLVGKKRQSPESIKVKTLIRHSLLSYNYKAYMLRVRATWKYRSSQTNWSQLCIIWVIQGALRIELWLNSIWKKITSDLKLFLQIIFKYNVRFTIKDNSHTRKWEPWARTSGNSRYYKYTYNDLKF